LSFFLDLDISLSQGKFNTRIARICNNVSDFNDRNLVIKKINYTMDTVFINY